MWEIETVRPRWRDAVAAPFQLVRLLLGVGLFLMVVVVGLVSVAWVLLRMVNVV